MYEIKAERFFSLSWKEYAKGFDKAVCYGPGGSVILISQNGSIKAISICLDLAGHVNSPFFTAFFNL
jgi:hypothetical protein